MRRIALWIDAIAPNPGGIGRYTLELARGLQRRSDLDAQLFGRDRIIDDPERLLSPSPLPRVGKWRRWRDRRALRASLVHGPNYFLPDFAETGIVTVHDLSVFKFPETHPADRVAAFEAEFLSSLSRAAHVITDSETIRAEIIDAFSVPPESVTSIPLGADPAFAPQAPDLVAPVLAQFGLEPTNYALCVSTLEPRKNIGALLDAWRLLPAATRAAFPLVLCGGAGWRNSALLTEIEQARAEGWLHFLGFVDEGLLPALYAGAALFIYPSSYEGFGLPPLEAMASGTPVLVANRSCLPELCGASARYMDPDDRSGLSAIIAESLADEQWRGQASRDGLSRAAQFTWTRCVDETIAIYERFR